MAVVPKRPRPIDTGPVDRLTFQGVLGMKSAILVLRVAAMIDVAACRGPSHSAGRQPNPSDQIAASTTARSNNVLSLETLERRAIGVVSPQQLYDEYTRSQFAAESNYDGQFLKVVGPLIGIGRDRLDAAVLRLGLGPTYAPGAAIDARFNREDEDR
jgi:hypothetical protein